ncbi:MAG: hypothetical protein IJU40_03120, partial [Desulfovibrionaceae bacterium]|nr:hypothetical protein [Desulfovibrionaceae bacterium]
MANTNYLSLSLSSLALKNSPELQTIALKKINQDYITYYEYYPGSIMTLHIEDGFFALNRSDSKIKLSEDNKTITADYVYLRDNFDKISINLSDTFFKAANANLNFYDTLTISLDDEELNSQYGKTVSIYADNYEASFFKRGNKYSFINSLKGLTASNFKSNATFKNQVYTNTKVIDAEKSPTNKKDDKLCWAATASNMLTWTQWADQGLNLKNKTNKEDLVFREFINNFTNQGSHQSFGIDWFFDGSYEKSNDLSWSQPAKDSGNYLQRTSQPYITYFSEIDPLNFISHLISGEAVGLSIRPTDGSGSWHAITCFGFEFNPKLAFTDKNFLCGIYITDSDDEKTSKNPTDTLVYLPVSWNNKNKCYIFTDVDYNQDYYLEDFTTLERYQTATHQNTTKIIKVNESEISSQQEILKSNLQVVYPQASSENEIISGGESLILNEASSKNSLIIAGKQVVYGLSQDTTVQAKGTLAI